MLNKEDVLQILENLPDRFSLDALLDQMIKIEKIRRGMTQSDNNEIIADDALDHQLSKWLK